MVMNRLPNEAAAFGKYHWSYLMIQDADPDRTCIYHWSYLMIHDADPDRTCIYHWYYLMTHNMDTDRDMYISHITKHSIHHTMLPYQFERTSPSHNLIIIINKTD